MFEITSDDIAELNDSDLRSLVGLLCEAELRQRGLPDSAVTWGGNQNAADGGIDVRVALPAAIIIDGFVPRPLAGYQVKKPDMTAAAIEPEMCPERVLRPSIRALAEGGGAYIIVSSRANTSDTALAERRAAMTRALGPLHSRSALFLDFYDRARMATWVRHHAGIGLWVRSKVGRAVPGWRPYGAWAFSPDGVADTYLLEDQARLYVGMTDERGVPVAEGIRHLRDILRGPHGVVRLVGLSGVGKTRLVQALFDARVGENSLDSARAVYTDMADSPDPQPVTMATDLIAARQSAILIVDNCPPDLHQRLSERCRAPDSTVTVITIEYDIQDDQPEGTDVFRLEPASAGLIEKLLARRHPEMSQVDARTIARFSGGNARIALALANTLDKNETLAGLSNQELFRRLFHQRQAHDETLLRAAQTCALVYSLQGEAIAGADAELPKLGALAGMSAQELYGKVAELRRRDLLQRRSVWRAVLPQAIANRLAAMALQNIPIAAIEAQFDTERLMRSFSRRLGYLHDSPEAVRLVEGWLGPGGKLANLADLNDLGRVMFANLAAVSPPATLAALERATGKPEWLSLAEGGFGLNKTPQLLRSLAYEPKLFDRSVALLVKLAEGQAREGKRDDILHIFEELFHICLSGTHAPVEQRIRCVEGLLRSDDPVRRSLGVTGLNGLLKAWQFHSSHSFEFGARSRDFGYWPRERHEIEHWYSCIVRTLVEPLATSDLAIAEPVRHALAAHFRGLWRKAQIYDDLERVSLASSATLYWQEGWIAVRKTLRLDAAHLSEEGRARLAALERKLRPRVLVQQVRAVVLTRTWGALDFADSEEEGDEGDVIAPHLRAQVTAERLGVEVAGDAAAFQELLPDLVRGDGTRVVPFGRGLARAAPERRTVWESLVEALRKTPEDRRNLGVLAGYLNGLRETDPALCDAVLEEAVTEAMLAPWFPALQTSVPLDARAVDRLLRSLAHGRATVAQFNHLAGGRSTDPLTGPELSALLLALAAKPEGFAPALHILSMRIHSDRDAKRTIAPELIAAGRELLIAMVYAEGDDSQDYRLRVVARTCLAGEGGAEAAAAVAQQFKASVATYDVFPFHYDQFVQGLFKAQPRAMLDAVLGGEPEDRSLGVRVIEDICHVHEIRSTFSRMTT